MTTLALTSLPLADTWNMHGGWGWAWMGPMSGARCTTSAAT